MFSKKLSWKISCLFHLGLIGPPGSLFRMGEDSVTWLWDVREELNLTARVSCQILKAALTIPWDDVLDLLTGGIYSWGFLKKQNLGSAPSSHSFPFMSPFDSVRLCALMSAPDRSPRRKESYSSLDRRLEVIQGFEASMMRREAKPQKASSVTIHRRAGTHDQAETSVP